MDAPELKAFPTPPSGKTGWPWTETTPALPTTMPDGHHWPRISIVTPSYNQGQFIEETIRSVLLQSYPNLEYIIIDGGSTDESVAIIKKYEPWLTYWVSEKDHGQSHAINKGLAHTTGTIFNWINSDDLLLPCALATVAWELTGHDALAGAVINFAEDSTELTWTLAALVPQAIVEGRPEVVFHQPGFWMRRAYIMGCGGIDRAYHYVFDWDLLIRYLSLYPHIQYTPLPLARFRVHDGSKTVRVQARFRQERLLILRKLVALERFALVHRACSRVLRSWAWWFFLEQLRGNAMPQWHRALLIAVASCADPGVRWSRLTLGSIRRGMFGHKESI
jgi:glycosyltransferase involved in cell wall biosynthesis